MRLVDRHPSHRTSLPARTQSAADAPSERNRGQALVEFAMVLPVFFLLVAGMFDFGLGIYSDLTLVNAAREGARVGAIEPGDTSAIEDHVRAMAANLDADRLSVSIDCLRPAGTSFTACSTPEWQPGDATLVTVGYTYRTFFPLLFGTEIPLSSEARMRIE
jgi:Flp pilus assembly protein TadG